MKGRVTRWWEGRWAIRESDGGPSSGSSSMPKTSSSEIEAGIIWRQSSLFATAIYKILGGLVGRIIAEV